MPFIITRREDPAYPMFLVQEFDGEVMWDARRRYATLFTETEADTIAADINRHASTEAMVEGVRNTVESDQCQ
jgi:hypothetical protein